MDRFLFRCIFCNRDQVQDLEDEPKTVTCKFCLETNFIDNVITKMVEELN